LLLLCSASGCALPASAVRRCGEGLGEKIKKVVFGNQFEDIIDYYILEVGKSIQVICEVMKNDVSATDYYDFS
jgi:hypothetical protein